MATKAQVHSGLCLRTTHNLPTCRIFPVGENEHQCEPTSPHSEHLGNVSEANTRARDTELSLANEEKPDTEK